MRDFAELLRTGPDTPGGVYAAFLAPQKKNRSFGFGRSPACKIVTAL